MPAISRKIYEEFILQVKIEEIIPIRILFQKWFHHIAPFIGLAIYVQIVYKIAVIEFDPQRFQIYYLVIFYYLMGYLSARKLLIEKKI